MVLYKSQQGAPLLTHSPPNRRTSEVVADYKQNLFPIPRLYSIQQYSNKMKLLRAVSDINTARVIKAIHS